MKNFLATTFLAFSLFFVSFDAMSITDSDIASIKDRIEGYSTDELIERRNFLINIFLVY